MKNLFLVITLFCAHSTRAATEISPFFGIGNDAFAFNIESLGAGTGPLEFEPNIPSLSRIGINAYDLGLAISTRADVKTLDPSKGKSEFFDVQLGYHNLKWGADLSVQNYTGFYMKNAALYGGNPFFTYPNLKWTHYGLMGRYAMDNQGFLISALTTQSEQIKKSAGSYFIVGGYRYHSLDSDISLIPTALQGINTEIDFLRKLKANSINLGFGAGKYWVNDSHVFIGGVFDLLGTYALYNYESLNLKTNSSYGSVSYNYKFAFGYSGENFRAGFSLGGDVTTLRGPSSAFIKPIASQILIYIRVAF
jgi:hypothetical protein